MSDALFNMLGVDETASIDPDEVEAIKRLLKQLQVDAAEIARGNDTADTKALLTALALQIKDFRANANAAQARKIIDQHSRGEQVSFGNDDPETARKAAEYDQLKEQLDALQSASKGASRGLGSGSGTDAILEQLRPFVEADPKAGSHLVEILTSLTGGPEDTRKDRSILALTIAEGNNPDWILVKDPASGQMLPVILVDARAKIKQLEADKRKMTADLDTNVNGSIGWKAAAFDYNVDASNADGYQALLNAAVSDKSAVQQQLADERDPSVTNSLAQQLANERDPKVANSLAQKLESAEAKAKTNAALPTDVVKKADVKSRVDAVQTELGKVKMGLTGVQNVNETRAALNKVADLVK